MLLQINYNIILVVLLYHFLSTRVNHNCFQKHLLLAKGCHFGLGLFDTNVFVLTSTYISVNHPMRYEGCHGRDCMVVGFTTTCTCAISAYYHLSCEIDIM